jgi:murein L,D-transpeptidase YcbB/YkuD
MGLEVALACTPVRSVAWPVICSVFASAQGPILTRQVDRVHVLRTTLGFYTGPITGRFGSLTRAAVKAFQKARGLDQAGYVGPATRAALNR